MARISLVRGPPPIAAAAGLPAPVPLPGADAAWNTRETFENVVLPLNRILQGRLRVRAECAPN
jgi:hypothetical protein